MPDNGDDKQPSWKSGRSVYTAGLDGAARSQRNKWINCRSKCTYEDDRDADGAVDPFPSSL